MLIRSNSVPIIVVITLLASWPQGSSAALGTEGLANQHAVSTRGFVPAALRFRLTSAHELARSRLATHAPCRELFDSMGADGLTILEGSTYSMARAGAEQSICSERSAAAFTTVNGQRVHLCPRLFSGLAVHKAAMILLHESLHRAGLSEWPHNPDGLRSVEINALIRDRCRL